MSSNYGYTPNFKFPLDDPTGIADGPTYNEMVLLLDALLSQGGLFGAKEWKSPVANTAQLPSAGEERP